MLLRPVSDLRVLELYNLSDLPCIIPACQSPSQFAKMALQDTEDSKAWNTFLRYLGRSSKVHQSSSRRIADWLRLNFFYRSS